MNFMNGSQINFNFQGNMAAQPTYGSQTQQRPRVPQNSVTYLNGQYTQYAGYQQHQQAPRYMPAVQQPVGAGAYHGYAPRHQMSANIAVPRGCGYPQMPPTQGVASPHLQVLAGSKAPRPTYPTGPTPYEVQLRLQQQRQQQQQQRQRDLQLQAFYQQVHRGKVPQNDITPLVPVGAKHQDVVARDINMRAGLPPAQQQQQAQQEPIDLTADDAGDEVQIIEPAQGQDQDEVAVVPAPARPPPSQEALAWIKSTKLRYRGKNLEHAAEANASFKLDENSAAERVLNSKGAGKTLEFQQAAEKKAQEDQKAQPAQPADSNKKRKSSNENSMADTERDSPQKKKARMQEKASGLAEKIVVDVSESESSTSRTASEAAMPDAFPSGSPPVSTADFNLDLNLFIHEDEDKAIGSDLEIEMNPETDAHRPATPVESVSWPKSMTAEPKKRGRPKGVKNRTLEEKEATEAEKERKKQEKATASKPGSKKRKSCEDNSMADEESDAPLAKKARAPKKAQEKPAPVHKNEKERKRVEGRANNKAAKAAFLDALNRDSVDGAISASSPTSESLPEPESSPVPFQRAATADLLEAQYETAFAAQEAIDKEKDNNQKDDGMTAQQHDQTARDIAPTNAIDDLFGSESVVSEGDAVPSIEEDDGMRNQQHSQTAGDIVHTNSFDYLFDSESVISEEDAVPTDNEDDGTVVQQRSQAIRQAQDAARDAEAATARQTAYSSIVYADAEKVHLTSASNAQGEEEESHEEYCQRLKDRIAAEKADPERFARERAAREAVKDKEAAEAAAKSKAFEQARAAERAAKEETERQAQKELNPDPEMSEEEKRQAVEVAAAAQRQRTIDEDSVVVELRKKIKELQGTRSRNPSFQKKLTANIVEAEAKLEERIKELQASVQALAPWGVSIILDDKTNTVMMTWTVHYEGGITLGHGYAIDQGPKD